MLKRARWLTVGFGLGVGATVAAHRSVRRRVEAYQPSALKGRVSDGLQAVWDELAAAVEDGRTAARERESELRNGAGR
jgi:hypothetical protein